MVVGAENASLGLLTPQTREYANLVAAHRGAVLAVSVHVQLCAPADGPCEPAALLSGPACTCCLHRLGQCDTVLSASVLHNGCCQCHKPVYAAT